MAANFQECLRLVKEAHPDLYPIWWIKDKGQLLFCMLKRGIPQEEAAVNFYAIDGKNVSGSIPVMSIYGNDALAEKLKQPNMVDPEDRKIDEKNTVIHSAGWGIRKNTSNLRIKSVRRGVGFEAEEAPLHDSRDDFLCHYGIKGQKWGVRKYQNEDGTLTQLGKERYGISSNGRRKENTDSKELPPDKRKALTDSLFGQLRKSGRASELPKDFAKNTKTSSGKISKDSDFYIRDRLQSSEFRVLKEDLNNHSYVVESRKANGGYAIVKRDGNDVSIAAYGREGLIKQNISGKTIKKLEDALGVKETNRHAETVEDRKLREQEEQGELTKKYGETKEERKRREQREWEEATQKEKADIDLGKRLSKFDKQSPEEQNKALKDVKSKIDELDAKYKKDGGLDHDDKKTRDGLLDWYIEKVANKNKKLLDEWWVKREAVRSDDQASNRMESQYTKKLLKAMNLPETKENIAFVQNFFIFWDD